MPGEAVVGITNPSIPGLEIQFVTQEAFDEVWSDRGWVIAEVGLQPDREYSIPSTEKGAPFGVATLDEFGNVVQLAQGPTGGVSLATMNAAIAAAIGAITPESIGAIPESQQVVTFISGVLKQPKRATHPSVDLSNAQYYCLTDNTVWVMAPTGVKTQLAPGFVSPSVELATEKTVNSLTLSTVLTTTLDPDSVYDLTIAFVYEATVAASGERLRLAFDPPPGATGWWGVQGLAVTQAAANGSASYLAKQWDETFDIGGSGAGTANARWGIIRGTVFTSDHEPAPNAEANFDFRARLSTLDGAGVPLVAAKIYGANTVDYDAARMTLKKIGP
jgi:hypothetical protein